MKDHRASAADRRAHAVEVGLSAFADHGVTTTAVQQVATQMGVSQPYVFRLFGSKKAFFLACIDELPPRITEMLLRAGTGAAEPLEEMGAGFRTLVADGVISGFWLQACAAARADEEIASKCRDVISRALQTVTDSTGVDSDVLAGFFGRGALVMMLQTLGVDLREGSHAAVASLVEKR
ncbi:MAG TPA: TetR family transcriptional regulator [Microbacterium sp.]|uniref:TetR/AcrR family transcriptional regulator n=1 Tax=Microbacterium sp. TaxID=51671 RepID=UPI000ED0F159|nr:TetR family transcriptional regulator [Microbacterium sp.]